MHNLKREIGNEHGKLRLEPANNFSTCDEGVNEEGVARETILSHPLALSYLECLCIRCLDPLHNNRYSHLCQKYF